MQYLKPIKFLDVKQARQKILDIIRHLEETGEIVIERS
jgi:flagellar motor switch protein FliG